MQRPALGPALGHRLRPLDRLHADRAAAAAARPRPPARAAVRPPGAARRPQPAGGAGREHRPGRAARRRRRRLLVRGAGGLPRRHLPGGAGAARQGRCPRHRRRLGCRPRPHPAALRGSDHRHGRQSLGQLRHAAGHRRPDRTGSRRRRHGAGGRPCGARRRSRPRRPAHHRPAPALRCAALGRDGPRHDPGQPGRAGRPAGRRLCPGADPHPAADLAGYPHLPQPRLPRRPPLPRPARAGGRHRRLAARRLRLRDLHPLPAARRRGALGPARLPPPRRLRRCRDPQRQRHRAVLPAARAGRAAAPLRPAAAGARRMRGDAGRPARLGRAGEHHRPAPHPSPRPHAEPRLLRLRRLPIHQICRSVGYCRGAAGTAERRPRCRSSST